MRSMIMNGPKLQGLSLAGVQPTTLYPCATSLTGNSRLSNDHTEFRGDAGTKIKTYNSGDSPVVTHLTTSPPVRCLNRAERTGSLVFNVLWSYVKESADESVYIETELLQFPGNQVWWCWTPVNYARHRKSHVVPQTSQASNFIPNFLLSLGSEHVTWLLKPNHGARSAAVEADGHAEVV
jgi:hypothetical protein